LNRFQIETQLGVERSVLEVCFLFDVGRWKFDVGCSSYKPILYGTNATCEKLQNNSGEWGQVASRI
jgi:hypothetical protein